MKTLKSIIGLLALSCATSAFAWPTQPVRIIVPSSAGAAPDNMVRMIATALPAELNQSVVVENKVGAGGIAARRALDLAKDNHTFLLTLTSTTTVAPLIFKAAADWNYLEDTSPVMTIGQTPFMIVAHPQSGVKTLQGLIERGKNEPGQVPFATPPLSSIAQLSTIVLSQTADVTFNFVPFSRSADSLSSVHTGDTQFFVDAVSVVLPFVKSGRVQPIAVLSKDKLPGLEEYPLANETVQGLEVTAGFGLVAPKDTDPAVVEAMYKAVSKTLEDPELVRKLQDAAIFVDPAGPEAYQVTLEKDASFWKKVIDAANITPQ